MDLLGRWLSCALQVFDSFYLFLRLIHRNYHRFVEFCSQFKCFDQIKTEEELAKQEGQDAEQDDYSSAQPEAHEPAEEPVKLIVEEDDVEDLD